MYHPVTAAAEYLELVNISSNAVTLYDYDVAEPWKITKGIDHTFSSNSPLTMASGERIVLVRDATAFALENSIPSGIQVIQWDSGALNNGGETIDISQPGDVDELNVRQYIRVDRVDYSDRDPWPVGPDGDGTSLVRIDERRYGNDVANWTESTATAGQSAYQKWAAEEGLLSSGSSLADDPDGDDFNNAMEYALGTDPHVTSDLPWELTMPLDRLNITFSVLTQRFDVVYFVEKTDDLVEGNWDPLISTQSTTDLQAEDADHDPHAYYRLTIQLLNQY